MDLSLDQEKAYQAIRNWYRSSDKFFVLAGYAGTGKTTLAKLIAERLGADDVVFCAYTGKAANVLREKGCQNSGTIHSFLYQFIRMENDKPVFRLDPKFGAAKLVIVDEYSMLSDKIIEHINNSANRVLYLGDPFQLPPVNNQQTLLKPDLFMESIQRQALESPILRYATKVRQGDLVDYCDEGDFKYVRRNTLTLDEYMNADQFICGRNDTRKDFNNRARRYRGFTSALPQRGDKVIITRNNPAAGVFNGMIDIAAADANPFHEGSKYQLALSEVGTLNFLADPARFDFSVHKDLNTLDYAYAITCHKSQGSEFDHVIVYNEPIGKDNLEKRRWAYTAATRAKKTLILTDARIRDYA
ncbi:ATP-dependent RecD-like DNA helicase [Hymenobacter sp. HSC-4F20]|uniref:ATP-dependent DNA helicase n=1 Tax=Hymenobacter sp. HSC-4F20 TaxID=2864135 RepID=UPI001C729FEB|nr:ATP-dependent RecD-like DNA helicase [Hymenobacter sp. HSC-4F20]MBX0289700.1 ATP-dependent RecD-like DNA helicase [Hymenobacter sp. HSC-4F20]